MIRLHPQQSCSPSPPRVCRGSAVRHLATSPMLSSTLRWHALSLYPSLRSSPLSLVASAHVCQLTAPVRPALPSTRSCSPKLCTRRNRVHLVFVCLRELLCTCSFSIHCLWVPVARHVAIDARKIPFPVVHFRCNTLRSESFLGCFHLNPFVSQFYFPACRTPLTYSFS